jgi:spore germination protein GerM
VSGHQERPGDGRARTTLVAVLLLIGASLAACGIPTESSPRALTDANTTTTVAPAVVGNAARAVIYLSRGPADEELVDVVRGLDSAPSPTTLLEALLQAPNEAEAQRQLTTLIPADTTLVAADLDEETDLLTVEFSEEQWQTLQGDTATGAYAQVVLTVTRLDGVSSVQFVLDGAVITAPTPEGNLKDVVTASDYRALDPG